MSYGQRKCANDELLSYFQVEAPIHHPSFFQFFSLTIKDKTKISLTIKILHLGQGSFTRKIRTIFTLKIIVSIFVKLFLILVLHLRQFFIVRIFVKRATDYGTVSILLVFPRLNFFPCYSTFIQNTTLRIQHKIWNLISIVIFHCNILAENIDDFDYSSGILLFYYCPLLRKLFSYTRFLSFNW